jgi:hypothetical protein
MAPTQIASELHPHLSYQHPWQPKPWTRYARVHISPQSRLVTLSTTNVSAALHPSFPRAGVSRTDNKKYPMIWKSTAYPKPFDERTGPANSQLFTRQQHALPSWPPRVENIILTSHPNPKMQTVKQDLGESPPRLIQIDKCTFPRPSARPQDAHIFAFAVCSAPRSRLLHHNARHIMRREWLGLP